MDASVSVQLSGTAHPSKPGLYALIYTATDAADLAGTWGTGGAVSTSLAADQTGLPVGCVRRVFSVEFAETARKFLRLRATLAK